MIIDTHLHPTNLVDEAWRHTGTPFNGERMLKLMDGPYMINGKPRRIDMGFIQPPPGNTGYRDGNRRGREGVRDYMSYVAELCVKYPDRFIGNFNFTVAWVPEANRNGLQRDYFLQQLTINESGSLEIIADWTFASNDIDVELFRGTCTPALITSTGCPLIAGTTAVTTKPERLTVNVTPGAYTIGITNYGQSNESGVGQVFLTR